MCDIGFEKTQDHAGKVNRMSVNAEKQPSEGFFKTSFMINFAEFTKKSYVLEYLSW